MDVEKARKDRYNEMMIRRWNSPYPKWKTARMHDFMTELKAEGLEIGTLGIRPKQNDSKDHFKREHDKRKTKEERRETRMPVPKFTKPERSAKPRRGGKKEKLVEKKKPEILNGNEVVILEETQSNGI